MQEPSIRQKVYISCAAAGMPQSSIEDILSVSLRNNARDGLTGLLIAHEGSFLQVLEGDAKLVERCYKRIERDPRHHSLIPLFDQESAERTFPSWRMGFARPDALSAPARDAVIGLYALHDERFLAVSGHAPNAKARALISSFLGSFRALRA